MLLPPLEQALGSAGVAGVCSQHRGGPILLLAAAPAAQALGPPIPAAWTWLFLWVLLSEQSGWGLAWTFFHPFLHPTTLTVPWGCILIKWGGGYTALE